MKSIKTISVNSAFVDQDGNTEHDFLSSLNQFDAKGNVVEEVSYSEANVIESKSSFIYDNEGHLLEETTWLDEEEISDKKKYTYNEEGKIRWIEIEYSDGSKSTHSIEYSDKLIKLTITDENGEFDGSETRKFDENGNIIELTKIDSDGETEQKFISEYDEKQNLISNIEFDRDGDIRVKRHYEYDEKNRRIIDTGYNLSDEINYTRTYTYNDADQLVEETVNDYTIIYEYDDKGKDTRQITYNNKEIESIKLFRYTEDGLLDEEISVHADEKYTLVPQLLHEEDANYLSKKYTYEFYE
jgi:hypothetical protein